MNKAIFTADNHSVVENKSENLYDAERKLL